VPGGGTLALFGAAALALLLVPGPSVLYIVAQSIDHGRRAGIVSTLGIQCGSLVHITAATIGLSSLLVSSALAFDVVKYAGAAYLVAIGVQRLLRAEQPAEAALRPERSLGRLFRQGVVVNVLNPKTALFFLAFLPQFVDADAGRAPLQIVVLGLVFVSLGLVTDGSYALLAGTLGDRLRESRRYLAAQRWVSGTVFVGLGVTAALTGQRARH
jgi:threonine/homoserine/homoserine lactone efflux protein